MLNPGNFRGFTIKQNEAILQDTLIGFLESEAEPVHFLSVDRRTNIELNNKQIFEMKFSLTTEKNFYERTAYTLLDVLGDFGGFNDAIVFLISSVMGIYSAKMYAAQISAELSSRYALDDK